MSPPQMILSLPETPRIQPVSWVFQKFDFLTFTEEILLIYFQPSSNISAIF
eukprot:c8057_g1_i1 orf=69-221(-)